MSSYSLKSLSEQLSTVGLVIATRNRGKFGEFSSLLEPFEIELFSAADLSAPEVAETGGSYQENALIKSRQVCEFSRLPCLADDSGISIAELGHSPGLFSARFKGDDGSFEGAALSLSLHLGLLRGVIASSDLQLGYLDKQQSIPRWQIKSSQDSHRRAMIQRLSESFVAEPVLCYFHCALSLCYFTGSLDVSWSDDLSSGLRQVACYACVEGRWLYPSLGEAGFGYDGFFRKLGSLKRFAEQDDYQKHHFRIIDFDSGSYSCGSSHRSLAFGSLANRCLLLNLR